MTDSPSIPTPAEIALPAQQSQIASAALAFWLAIQLGVMALALLHIPLALEYTMSEQLLPEMLVLGQMVFAAMLAPSLCRNFATTAVAAASVCPPLILAGGLAMRPLLLSLLSGAMVTAWLVILGLWCNTFRSRAMRSVISATAVLVSGGVVLLVYLAKEFGPSPLDDHFFITPVLATWSASHAISISISTIIAYAVLGAVPATILAARYSRGRRAVSASK